MDPNAKKTALRMIPYGLFVLTAAEGDGEISAGDRELGDAGLVRAAARRGRRQDRLPRATRSSRSRRPSR